MTLYDKNIISWKIGDVVIHDSDEKHPKMLMVVRGYDKNTKLYKTRYVDVHQRKHKLMRNDVSFLHDPNRFGINPIWGTYMQTDLNLVIRNWDKVKFWNYKNPIGTKVYVRWKDAGFYATTKTRAWINEFAEPCIILTGKCGYWLLDEIVSV